MPNKPTYPEGLDNIILGFLNFAIGEQNAKPREDLLAALQPQQICTDSQMRLAIQALRADGYLICSSEGGAGYFMAGAIEEYEHFKAKYTAKARTVFIVTRAMDKTASLRFDYNPEQEKMEGVYNVQE